MMVHIESMLPLTSDPHILTTSGRGCLWYELLHANGIAALTKKQKQVTQPSPNEKTIEMERFWEGRRRGNSGRERRGRGGEQSAAPVLLDGEAPVPGQVDVLVVVYEGGLDAVGAAGHQAPGGLVHGRYVLLLLAGPRPVAAHHVGGPVHWQWAEEQGSVESLQVLDCIYTKLF